ncbi:RNA ligase family protein [Aureivirga marina]|uniref:RNA ligase family protein n=1 Tax=Aureivirga marina TaxID=1182451 RepID=UPI0018CBCF85|nr:RNA ligase family protein [Aureivirga marina]
MKFKKFNSIENSYQEKFIESIYENGFDSMNYVVQEKVHGANFSFITDGKEIKIAKRTDFIEKEENFYNSYFILEKYKEKVIALFEFLAETKQIQTLTVFGELFGGGYPHKDVPRDNTAKLVQKGIYYHKENDFFAFDILLDNVNYLEVEEANELFENFDFIFAKTLFKGTLEACLTFENTFKTTIPTFYNLPEIEGNICEGVIIRPEKATFFPGGSRVLIKNKNEAWSENNGFIDRELLHKTISGIDKEISEELKNLCEKAITYISENRLNNVISKIGEIKSRKEFGKILGMYNKDILQDFEKENELYKSLEKQNRKIVSKIINERASKLVEAYFTTIFEETI